MAGMETRAIRDVVVAMLGLLMGDWAFLYQLAGKLSYELVGD
jgi:hypothetical protein